MATKIYLPKPHRRCGSSTIIFEIIEYILAQGKKVGVIIPNQKFIQISWFKEFDNVKIVYASSMDELTNKLRGSRFDIIFVLDSEYIKYDYETVLHLFTKNVVIEKSNIRIDREIYNT